MGMNKKVTKGKGCVFGCVYETEGGRERAVLKVWALLIECLISDSGLGEFASHRNRGKQSRSRDLFVTQNAIFTPKSAP